jgi:hypothetical protein
LANQNMIITKDWLGRDLFVLLSHNNENGLANQIIYDI